MAISLKSEQELDKMRASADLVARVLGEVARLVEPEVTTQQLDQVAEEYIRKHDAIPAFKGYGAESGNPFPATLCVSVNDVVVHGIPDDYALQEGDLVSVDCGVILDGFYGDSAYTFAVGRVSEEKARLCKTTCEALYEGISQAVHGKRIGDISCAVQTYCQRSELGVVHELVGHGIGQQLHEDPQVPNVGFAGRGRMLRSGMTLCIEPMINLGVPDIALSEDGWTVRTADRKPSAHYEHMVAVCGEAPEILTTFEYIEDIRQPFYRKETLTYG